MRTEDAKPKSITMSSIANFYLINVSKLDELKQHAEIIVKKTLFSKKTTDNYYDYLANNATPLKNFNASGHLYGNLLVFWDEERKMDLMNNEYNHIASELTEKRDCSNFIFTYNQKTTFLQRLDPANYSVKELQAFNADFSEDGDEETAQYTLEAIRVFHDNLNEIQNDQQVMLLIIG